ncbi:TetR/AcrR family transcriptional regulator [Bacillus mesophilum]|uniref:TetR/AcrR family transcriptional regulator n=1 Tax=Bacillus mesophilum TaxID=1071718 RepID=A0A7V7RQC1_9BACI|nr:TetR/AcrR family transcriptional regulator [Bacillus mesophilum]KAB2335137.1 TetR/AcrR family transcriptional regulator [Bacillus mesophilum]
MTKHSVASKRTKEKIINAARSLFKIKGYSDTTITDIINEGGISRGNLYYHFDNKEALFLHVMEEDARIWLEEWHSYCQQFKNPKDRLYGLAEFYADTAISYPISRVQKEFLSSILTVKTSAKKLEAINLQYLKVCENIFQEAQNKGYWEKYDISFLTLLLSSILNGIEEEANNIPKDKLKEIFTKGIDIFLNGID